MLTVPIAKPWSVVQPMVYRMLERRLVEAFHTTGALRLSSFAKFRSYTDEYRGDSNEAKVKFEHAFSRPDSHELEYLSYGLEFGRNAYILCTTMCDSSDIVMQFGGDACIAIQDTVGFAAAVAQKIPGFLGGNEGPCLYIQGPTVRRDFGVLPLELTQDKLAMQQFIVKKLELYPYYVKNVRFAPQLEYRLVWLCDHTVEQYLDIEVPDARQYCQRDWAGGGRRWP